MNCSKCRKEKEIKDDSMSKHFFVVIEHENWNHDDDEWVGIFSDIDKLRIAYNQAAEYILQTKIRQFEDNRSVNIYEFDEQSYRQDKSGTEDGFRRVLPEELWGR